MREVAEHVTTGDTARIAILAALNLADELFQIQSRQEGERVEIREKVAELTGELQRALDGMPCRVEAEGSERSLSAKNIMEQGLASPAWFVMGTTIVEPTFILRESFIPWACASLASTRTLTAHGADTHLVAFRF